MGRENMADYNADFLTMLETWDAAVSFWPSRDGQAYQPIEIANLLGWTQHCASSSALSLCAARALDLIPNCVSAIVPASRRSIHLRLAVPNLAAM